jgi:hypothetical protein
MTNLKEPCPNSMRSRLSKSEEIQRLNVGIRADEVSEVPGHFGYVSLLSSRVLGACAPRTA